MNTATAEVQPHLHPNYVLGEKLGAEITELYGFFSNPVITVGARHAGDQSQIEHVLRVTGFMH